MKLSERIAYLEYIFSLLQDTTSMNEKRTIVEDMDPLVKGDFEYCLEVLNGKYKLGYTYMYVDNDGDRRNENNTVKDILEYLQEPIKNGDLSRENIYRYLRQTSHIADFLEPICNRTLKLGIGKSVLPKDGLSAMLAKKYEGQIDYCKSGYYVTEKLDGNRCIAHYDGIKWKFTSRNGKPMHVNFDMSGLPKDWVYDGEILSLQQTKLSSLIHHGLTTGDINTSIDGLDLFRNTSGMINRHSLDKKLVYNIFDIMIDGVPYAERRQELHNIKIEKPDVKILPVLKILNRDNLNQLDHMLDFITAMGGEGLMINLGDGLYEHKRTKSLLKYKQVKTMDMRVIATQCGTGKYYGQVGALTAECFTEDGKHIICSVGSGLSDEQRLTWAINTKNIVGKIIEVAYFSLSQNQSTDDTNIYSLRFPRLRKVRVDKNNTSEF